jgi:hypothetical protein
MVLSAPQLALRRLPLMRVIRVGVPPAAGIFISVPPAPVPLWKPSHSPSCEKNMPRALGAASITRVSNPVSERSSSRLAP